MDHTFRQTQDELPLVQVFRDIDQFFKKRHWESHNRCPVAASSDDFCLPLKLQRHSIVAMHDHFAAN